MKKKCFGAKKFLTRGPRGAARHTFDPPWAGGPGGWLGALLTHPGPGARGGGGLSALLTNPRPGAPGGGSAHF